MDYALDQALREITLVVFTTIGPSGALAFALALLEISFGNLSEKDKLRLGNYLIVPLCFSMAGLIASATHLGNPANALYVFLGVGRSPLSNEVLAIVVFLSVASVTWLTSYSRFTFWRKGGWTFLICATALCAVLFVSLAYSVNTIPTWNSQYVPVIQWLISAVLAAFLSVLTTHWAKVSPSRTFRLAVAAQAIAAFALSLVVLHLQNIELGSISNSWTSAAELVPTYGISIFTYAILQLLSGLLVLRFLSNRFLTPYMPLVACVLSSTGVFILRFSFYMLRIPAGI